MAAAASVVAMTPVGPRRLRAIEVCWGNCARWGCAALRCAALRRLQSGRSALPLPLLPDPRSLSPMGESEDLYQKLSIRLWRVVRSAVLI